MRTTCLRPTCRPVRAAIIRSASLAALAIAGGLAPGLALAQKTPEANGATRVDEIVVTASKRASTVQTTAISITAISGVQLQAQGVNSVVQIAAEAPGISFRSSGPGQTELEMRGMASSGGASPTVGFYLDETPLTPPAASLNGKVVIDPDLFDLNRVEVLRGPQGTLYGAGSMGGTVRLIANKPDPTKYDVSAEGILSGTPGAGVNPTANAMINLPIIQDKVALRVVGTEKYVSGWIDRVVVTPFPLPVNPCAAYTLAVGCQRGDLSAGTTAQDIPNVNWERLQSVRAGLLFKPTPALTIDLTAMFQKITMGGYSQFDLPNGVGSEPGPLLAHYQPFNTAEPFSDTFHLFDGTINYDLGFANVTSSTSYWSRAERQNQDISEGLRSDILDFYGLDISTPVLFTENDFSHQFSEEARLASPDGGRFQWLGGVFFSKLTSVFNDINGALPFAPASVGGAAANPAGRVYDSYNPYHVTQYAVFGEASYKIVQTLKLTAGLRWFKYNTQVDEMQLGSLTASGNATPTIASFATSASGVTPKFDLSWEPNSDLTVYASASKGFRPGGVNLPLPPVCALTQETYGPDSIWDYEVGEKARFFDRRLTINADVFYIRWTGVQQLVNQACGYSATASAGNAVSYGPELELNAKLTSEISFTASGAYTEAHLTSISPGVQAATGLASGTPILNIPKYTHSESLTWSHPISNDFTLVARATNAYVGRSTDISFGYVNLPAYDIVGLRLGVTHKPWSAFLFVDNLTNKVAELSTNTTSFSWLIPSLTRAATNQPRTIGIDVSYHF